MFWRPKDPLLKQCEAVNARVNREIRPMTDLAQYGRADVWVSRPATKRGDCDDYCLTKADDLTVLGVDGGLIAMWLVWTWKNECHAVLTVGDYVLDNLTSSVKPRAKRGDLRWGYVLWSPGQPYPRAKL